jgi:hypothetical protein
MSLPTCQCPICDDQHCFCDCSNCQDKYCTCMCHFLKENETDKK